MKTINYFKIRKKCEKCGVTMVLPVPDQFKEHFHKLKPCNGLFEPFSSDIQDATMNLIALAGYIHEKHNFGETLDELLEYTIEDLTKWSEREPTPQEMGWVDSQGRP